MTALDAALAAIDDQTCPEDDGLTRAILRGLMHGYHARWADAPWVTLQVEHPFLQPIFNPATGKPSRTFQHAGRGDGLIHHPETPGRLVGLEHKTASEDLSPDAPYWRRLVFDAQVSGYALARWQAGEKLTGTLYDVIRKPGIRPKALSKADRAGIASSGTYHGFRVSDPLRQAVAHTVDREDAELFELRLRRDCLDRAEWYFARREIPRLDAEIAEHADELWQIADEIRLARANDAHYRNSGACMAYGTPCGFLGICSGYDTPESDNWRQVPQVHAELDDFLEGSGRDVLTHSRMSTFRTCRRKHFYRYELGIERQDKEESYALLFGRIFHLALGAWWECYRNPVEAGNGNGNDDAPRGQ